MRACEENDIKLIGPTADVVQRMGDKVAARQASIDAGKVTFCLLLLVMFYHQIGNAFLSEVDV